MGFLSGLIGSVANFGLDQRSNSVNSKRQQFYNERNMELQHEYQKKMVDYVAEKNEPRKAVARWRAAGIAPEAVFGNSPGGAGVSSDASAPSSSNPDGGSSRYDFFRTAAEQQQMENDRKIADATVNKLNAEADKLRGDTKDPEVTKQQQKLDFDWALVKKEREEVQLEIDKINKQYEEAMKQADLSIKQQILFETLAKIDKLLADTEVSKQMKENLKSQKALIEAQAKTEGVKQDNLRSDAALNRAQAWRIEELTPAEEKEIRNRASELANRMQNLSHEQKRRDLDLLLETAGLKDQNEPLSLTASLIKQVRTTIRTLELGDAIEKLFEEVYHVKL